MLCHLHPVKLSSRLAPNTSIQTNELFDPQVASRSGSAVSFNHTLTARFPDILPGQPRAFRLPAAHVCATLNPVPCVQRPAPASCGRGRRRAVEERTVLQVEIVHNTYLDPCAPPLTCRKPTPSPPWTGKGESIKGVPLSDLHHRYVPSPAMVSAAPRWVDPRLTLQPSRRPMRREVGACRWI